MANIPENTTNPILRPVTRLETTTKVFGGEYIPDDAQQRGISNLQAIELAERDQYILSRVGQPYVPASGDIPAKAGIAGLDTSGKVPKTQLPTDTVYTEAIQTLKNKTIDAKDNLIKNTAVGLSTSATPKDVSGDSVFTFNANNTVVILGTAPYIGCKITFVTWNYTGYVVFKVSSDWKCVYMFAGQRLDFTCTGTGVWRLNDGQFLYVSASDIVTNAPNNPDTSVQLIPNDWRENYGCNIFSIDYAYAGSSSTYGTPDDRCVVTVKGVYARRIAQAQKWQNTGSPTPIWINKKHDSTWEGWNQISTDTEATTLENKTIDANNNTLNNVVTSKNISNCITKIPQDINLTLSSGTLTLKAGSKVYAPHGKSGDTLLFETVSISGDKTYTIPSGYLDGNYFIGVRFDNQGLVGRLVSNSVSGAGATTTSGYAYDTTANKIKQYDNSGSVVGSEYNSFPICVVTVSGGAITSIDQVFNGMGYIGSTIFALPGLKGLSPNGRNSDGSLKNTERALTSVSLANCTATGSRILFVTDAIYDRSISDFYYDETLNSVIRISDGAKNNNLIAATYTTTSGVISNFKPKTAFHAVDYNDWQRHIGSGTVHTISTLQNGWTGSISWLVRNGVCYVTLNGVKNSSQSFVYVDVTNTYELPKCSTLGLVIDAGGGATSLTARFTMGGGSTILSATNQVANVDIYYSFSYPVADDWVES